MSCDNRRWRRRRQQAADARLPARGKPLMEDWKPIVLEVDFTPDDLRHFFQAHNKRNARGLRIIMVLCVLAFFLVAFRLLALVWGWNPRRVGTPPIVAPANTTALDSLKDMLVSMAPYFGALIVLLIGLRLLQRALYSKAAEERNPYQRHHTIELSPERVTDSEPLSRHEFQWEAF